jgi:hypothetical protein
MGSLRKLRNMLNRRTKNAVSPEWVMESFQNELVVTESSRPRVASVYTTIVDGDRKYVWASDSSCELLAYKLEELIGKRYDEVTAPTTNDIPVTSSMFKSSDTCMASGC